MGALLLNSFSVAPSEVARVSNKCNSWRKKNTFVHCQGSGNAMKTNGVSSVLRESLKMVNADRSAAIMDAGSLIVSPNPNGNSQADIAVKDLVPYGGSTTSLVELQEGIGIVKFLRGKDFFITGSTGFLAKGNFFYSSLGFYFHNLTFLLVDSFYQKTIYYNLFKKHFYSFNLLILLIICSSY